VRQKGLFSFIFRLCPEMRGLRRDGQNVQRIDFEEHSTTTWTTVYTTYLGLSVITRRTVATELSTKERIVTVATPRPRSDGSLCHFVNTQYFDK